MDVSRRAEVLSRPTLISGLIEDWPALHEWTDAGAFAAAFADQAGKLCDVSQITELGLETMGLICTAEI